MILLLTLNEHLWFHDSMIWSSLQVVMGGNRVGGGKRRQFAATVADQSGRRHTRFQISSTIRTVSCGSRETRAVYNRPSRSLCCHTRHRAHEVLTGDHSRSTWRPFNRLNTCIDTADLDLLTTANSIKKKAQLHSA